MAPRAAGRLRIVFRDEVTSTSDLARELGGEPGPVWLVAVADAQTAGRGRQGRRWHSPSGAGLYCSVALDPVLRSDGSPSPWMTLMAGVAAAGALADVGARIALKWPNDLVVSGRRWRKLGGILSEGLTVGGRLARVILGIGINLRAADRPPELRDRVASLDEQLGDRSVRGELLARLLGHISAGVDALSAPGGERSLRDAWLRLSVTPPGTRVTVLGETDPRPSSVVGLDDEGRLVVEGADGVRRHVQSGEIAWSSDARADWSGAGPETA